MRFRKIAAALLTLALGFCLCQPAAFAATAADQHTQLQELPVSIQSTGETPLPKETLTVELEAVDNAPLPEVTTLEITDGETGSFGPISYTKPGYYVYTVRQRAGVNTRGTYDETVYYLRVSVVWDNDKLVARMAVHTQADLMDEKVSSITFNNSYKAIETPYYPDPYDPDPVTPPTPSTPENPAAHRHLAAGNGQPVRDAEFPFRPRRRNRRGKEPHPSGRHPFRPSRQFPAACPPAERTAVAFRHGISERHPFRRASRILAGDLGHVHATGQHAAALMKG